MDLQSYVDEIKLKLTGGVLDLEIQDEDIIRIINSCFREVQRYITTTKFETIPFSKCIDLNPRKINSIARIFRATTTGSTIDENSNSLADPVAIAQWQALSGNGNFYNMNQYINNYESWILVQQIRNTISTDLSYVYDDQNNKLYVNVSQGNPEKITIEYIPRFESVEEVKSDYWIDIIIQMCVAMTKIIVGRVRSKYTQTSALWTLDGATLLQEGTAELKELRDKLQANTQLAYPVD